MSLINQVLRDLDQRARPAASMPMAVRAAAARARSRLGALPAIALSAVLALGCIIRLAAGSSDPRAGAGDAARASLVRTGDAFPPTTPPIPASATGPAAASAPASEPWAFATGRLLTALPSDALPALALPLVPDAIVPATPAPESSTPDTVSRSEPDDAVVRPAAAAPAEAPHRPAAGPRPTGWLLDPNVAASDAGWSLRSTTVTTLPRLADAPMTAASAAADASSALAAPPSAPAASGPSRIEKRAAAIGPSDRAEAAYRLGTAAQQRGDDAEAASQYLVALHEAPAMAAARVGLASVRLAQGQAAEAEEVLRAGLADGPQQAVLSMPLGRLLAGRGELTMAIGVLQAGLAAGGAGDAGYRACFGAVLQRAGRHHEAAEEFNAALRLVPGNGVWWMGLAISLAADGLADAARSAYQQALAVGGLSPELKQFVQQRLQPLL